MGVKGVTGTEIVGLGVSETPEREYFGSPASYFAQSDTAATVSKPRPTTPLFHFADMLLPRQGRTSIQLSL